MDRQTQAEFNSCWQGVGKAWSAGANTGISASTGVPHMCTSVIVWECIYCDVGPSELLQIPLYLGVYDMHHATFTTGGSRILWGMVLTCSRLMRRKGVRGHWKFLKLYVKVIAFGALQRIFETSGEGEEEEEEEEEEVGCPYVPLPPTYICIYLLYAPCSRKFLRPQDLAKHMWAIRYEKGPPRQIWSETLSKEISNANQPIARTKQTNKKKQRKVLPDSMEEQKYVMTHSAQPPSLFKIP